MNGARDGGLRPSTLMKQMKEKGCGKELLEEGRRKTMRETCHGG